MRVLLRSVLLRSARVCVRVCACLHVCMSIGRVCGGACECVVRVYICALCVRALWVCVCVVGVCMRVVLVCALCVVRGCMCVGNSLGRLPRHSIRVTLFPERDTVFSSCCYNVSLEMG